MESSGSVGRDRERPGLLASLVVTTPGLALGAALCAGPGPDDVASVRAVRILGAGFGALLALLAYVRLARLGVNERRPFVGSLAVSMGCVLLLELAASVYVWRRGPRASCWLFDRSDRTFAFDAARGYRLSPTPSRFARITNGTLEYDGVYRGNNQGFQDRDDFGPARERAGALRVAVFGDSFTTGAFLQSNWPDRAEDLARSQGRDLQLLNFAVDGAGLANWATVLEGVVERERYELDAVVFAVFYDDLWRTYSFSDHRGFRAHMFSRTGSWDPARNPGDEVEARARLASSGAPIVGSDEYDRAVRSRRCSVEGAAPRVERPLRPVLVRAVNALLRAPIERRLAPVTPAAAPLPSEDPQRVALIERVAATVRARGVPVYVVFVPTRGHLVEPERYASDPVVGDIEHFASRVGATYIDGRRAFDGASREEKLASFFPFDGHWNQRGSDRFARFMAQRLVR